MRSVDKIKTEKLMLTNYLFLYQSLVSVKTETVHLMFIFKKYKNFVFINH